MVSEQQTRVEIDALLSAARWFVCDAARTKMPKTLIFAKDDSHAENIVKIVREEFGKGNEFAQKDHLPQRRTTRPSA